MRYVGVLAKGLSEEHDPAGAEREAWNQAWDGVH
jgi:hypothetical protein